MFLVFFNSLQFTFLGFNITAIFRNTCTSFHLICQLIENVLQLLLSDFMNCVCDRRPKFIQMMWF